MLQKRNVLQYSIGSLFIHSTENINNPIGCDKESSVKILTHCNTGSLATGGYGTALGVIRALQDLGRLQTAFCTETRFCEKESVEMVDFMFFITEPLNLQKTKT